MKSQLKILLVTSALFNLAAGLFGPLYAVFVKEIGGDLLTAGGAYAAFSLGAGVLIFFLSKWENRIKHQERCIVAGYVLSCIGFAGYLFVKTPIHLFAVQIILGLGEAVTTPAYDGVYSRFLGKGKFVFEWGMWESMYYIIIGIAALVGGYLANIYGFSILFKIMLGFSILGLIVSLSLLNNKSKKKIRKKKLKLKKRKR